MKTARSGWLPDAGADPEALIKEARRRQHRRYMMVCLVIVVLLAGAAGITAGVTGLSGHRPSRTGSARPAVARGRRHVVVRGICAVRDAPVLRGRHNVQRGKRVA